jgi:trans-AT polyketide synthase, acyltransferase and oxidoreductase domains
LANGLLVLKDDKSADIATESATLPLENPSTDTRSEIPRSLSRLQAPQSASASTNTDYLQWGVPLNRLRIIFNNLRTTLSRELNFEAGSLQAKRIRQPRHGGKRMLSGGEAAGPPHIRPERLGSSEFRRDHGVRYAYVAGSMYKGIASKEMVVAMARSKLLGYLGTGGMSLDDIESSIRHIQESVSADAPYGMNLLRNPDQPALEEATVDLFLNYGIRRVEAAAYMSISSALVRFRARGLESHQSGVRCRNQILAKVSRPEVASAFLGPAPEEILRDLVARGEISVAQAELARVTPMADDLCVEADSGGHTDGGVAFALFPAMKQLREEISKSFPSAAAVRVGMAGGIGAPEAAAAAFIMGADFILTGSINQCTVEAGTSDAVKDILETIDVQDTAYAPAGDMFELGAKVQVVRKGLFFHARANKLYELYNRHTSLDEIEPKTLRQIEEKYFQRSVNDVWSETKAYLMKIGHRNVELVEQNQKQKMAIIFKWYFVHSTRLALSGSKTQQVDYQIQCGPALGAFNRWVKGTELQSWRQRKVVSLAERIMNGAADYLTLRFNSLGVRNA